MQSLTARITLNSTKFLLMLGVVVFASAGTLRYWEGWIYVGLQVAGITGTNLYLLKKDPALLERRLMMDKTGEKDRVQKVIMGFSKVAFTAMMVFAGIDHRFGWSAVPLAVLVAAYAVFAAGSLLIVLVFRQNSYASSIIEVEAGQPVVTTGLYRIVRHPMYVGVLLMTLSTPLALGSYWALFLSLSACALILVRLLAEERLLSEQLQGYKEYMTKTRARLIPGVW